MTHAYHRPVCAFVGLDEAFRTSSEVNAPSRSPNTSALGTRMQDSRSVLGGLPVYRSSVNAGIVLTLIFVSESISQWNLFSIGSCTLGSPPTSKFLSRVSVSRSRTLKSKDVSRGTQSPERGTTRVPPRQPPSLSRWSRETQTQTSLAAPRFLSSFLV